MIPKPFAIAIDDLGWMFGNNEGSQGISPFRVGLKRKMLASDYEPIIEIAKRANVRIQGLFILGELDREGVVEKYKTTTPQKPHWQHQQSTEQLKAMDLVKSNSAFLEFGLHGVGHEYWPENSVQFKRAEWYNLDDKSPWPESSVKDHLDCFAEIMAQYDLTIAAGQSFPKSFVPCAYSYYWNPSPQENEYSLGEILHQYGVRYANTDFSKIPERNPPIDAGMDKGVHVMNRHNFGNLWYELGKTPTIPLTFHNTQFIETHWANLIAQDDFLQASVTDMWINYYASVNATEDRYCAKNTPEMHSQFLYHKYCQFYKSGDKWVIDNSAMPTSVSHTEKLQGLVIKVNRENDDLHCIDIMLNGRAIPAYFADDKYCYIYLPKLESKLYELSFNKGQTPTQDTIWHDTTNNYSKLELSPEAVTITGLFFGQQTITFRSKRKFKSIISQHSSLKIGNWSAIEEGWKIEIDALDIQGVDASIVLS